MGAPTRARERRNGTEYNDGRGDKVPLSHWIIAETEMMRVFLLLLEFDDVTPASLPLNSEVTFLEVNCAVWLRERKR